MYLDNSITQWTEECSQDKRGSTVANVHKIHVITHGMRATLMAQWAWHMFQINNILINQSF